MKIVSLIMNDGIERTVAYIELIEFLIKKGINVDIVIAHAQSGYIADTYYLNNANVNIQVLNIAKDKNSKIETIKNFVKSTRLKGICENLLLAYQRIFFLVRRKKYSNDKSYAYDVFLDFNMQNYRLKENYDYIMVNDEFGLLWANWINENSITDNKIIYYCLELYWEHYAQKNVKNWKNFFEYLLFGEAKKVLDKVYLTIIQDENRWKVLCRYTGLHEGANKVFLPLTMQPYNNMKSGVLCKKLKIEKNKKIIFYPTLIRPKRGCKELAQMSGFLDDEYAVIIHGFVGEAYFANEIKHIFEKTQKGMLSNFTFDYQELIDMHQDVWCVFLRYGESDNNDRFIANSSNKLVMSLQAGKPIVTVGNRMLANLCKETGCGVSLNSWSEEDFVMAISELAKNYEQYCQNARRCFEERYNINLYGDVLYDALMQNLNGGL